MAAEKNFERKVKQFLANEGCWLLKTWSNGVQRTGIPDLLVSCEGRFIGVELKASNGKPSALQIHELKAIEKANGYAILLYPEDYDVFRTFISAIKNSNYPVLTQSYIKLKERREKYDVV